MDSKTIASYIDHTLLKAFATPNDIEKLCKEATENHFWSVCINPVFVKLAAEYFKKEQSSVKVCTVIGFPLGATSTAAKVHETEVAIEDGADEVDMVIPIGLMKAGDYDAVEQDIKSVADMCKQHNTLLKVIIETCYLNDEEIEKASHLTFKAGAQFVKTSTGFGTNGATVEAVKIMRRVADQYNGKVKAAGGIRTYEDAMKMIEAGANRLGTSGGISIMKGCDA
ncbi:hypothetical protein WA158_007103 [Blastocystis sp. Blastoise]